MRFAQSFNLVGYVSSQIQEVCSHYFFCFCNLICFVLSFWDINKMNVRFFFYYYNPVVPEVLFILFGNIFFLLKLGDFYYSFFELIETFLFHSPVDAYSQGFLFCLLYFSVLILFGCLFFCLFEMISETFYIFLCFKHFVMTH